MILTHAVARNSGGTESAADIARLPRTECARPGGSSKHCRRGGRNAGRVGVFFSGNEGSQVRLSFIRFCRADLFEQLAASDLQSTITTQSNVTLPNITGSTPGTPIPLFSHSSPSPSEVGGSKPKGMQLGGHVPSTLSHAAEWAAEVEVEPSSLWGNDDLMDVNADQDDWSEMTFYPHARVQMLIFYSRCLRNCTRPGTRDLRRTACESTITGSSRE